MIKIKGKGKDEGLAEEISGQGEQVPAAGKVSRLKVRQKQEDAEGEGEQREEAGAEQPPPSGKSAEARLISLSNISREHKEKIGWVSPHYHTSRSVTLDAEAVYERRCTALFPEAPENEHYRVLRSHILRHTGKEGAVTVLVTSARPGEGKTLTAINLAFTFAQEFRHTALLVDCDLKKQDVHQVLGYQSEKGVSDHLLDDCPVSELMVWPGSEKLTIISGGRRTGTASALLGSPRMRELVQDLKGRYPERYVFLDAPPLLGVADALALVPLVDYVLVVTQAGKTAREDLQRAVGLVPEEKMLGVVLNR